MHNDTNTKVMFFTRELPIHASDGTSTHLLDFLSYANEQDLRLYFCMSAEVSKSRFWIHLPPEVLACAGTAFPRAIILNGSLLSTNILSYLRALLKMGMRMLRACYMLLPVAAREKIRTLTRGRMARTWEYTIELDFNPAAANADLSHGNDDDNSCDLQSRHNWLTPGTPAEELQFIACMRRFQPHAVIVDYVRFGKFLNLVPQGIEKYIFTHDVLSHRTQVQLAAGLRPDFPEWTAEREGEYLSGADFLLSMHDEDAAHLQSLLPSARTLNVLMPAPARWTDDPVIPYSCLFVGSGQPQNVEGIRWFISSVWPLVRKAVSGAKLTICGRICNFITTDDTSIELKGVVEDIATEYHQAALCVVPLKSGSGIKVKLVEALSYGKAVVSTPIGLQGLADLSGDVVLCADNPIAYAEQISSLMLDDNFRTCIESKAKNYASAHLSRDAAYKPLFSKLTSLTRDEHGGIYFNAR